MTISYTEAVEHSVHTAEMRMELAVSDLDFEVGILRDIMENMEFPQRVEGVVDRLLNTRAMLVKGGVRPN